MDSSRTRNSIWAVVACTAIMSLLLTRFDTSMYETLKKYSSHGYSLLWLLETLMFVLVPLPAVYFWRASGIKTAISWFILGYVALNPILWWANSLELFPLQLTVHLVTSAIQAALQTLLLLHLLKNSPYAQRAFYLLTLLLVQGIARMLANWIIPFSSDNHLLTLFINLVLALIAFAVWRKASIEDNPESFEERLEIDEWTRKIEEIGKSEENENPPNTLAQEEMPLRERLGEYSHFMWGIGAIFCFHLTEYFFGQIYSLKCESDYYYYSLRGMIFLAAYFMGRFWVKGEPQSVTRLGRIASMLCLLLVSLLPFAPTATLPFLLLICQCFVPCLGVFLLELATRKLGAHLPRAIAWAQIATGLGYLGGACVSFGIEMKNSNEIKDAANPIFYLLLAALACSFLVLTYYFTKKSRVE
ncbi:MAG: hypothetical protein ACKVTZ_08805 [Bacteroidia bacterium]